MLFIGNMALPVWQAIFLILLSFGSLVIALYCLLFMVPLKKFVQRIESLGGGMEGLKKHLNGVETYVEGELERIEAQLNNILDTSSSAQEGRIDSIRQKTETMRERLQQIETELKRTDETIGEIKDRMEKKSAHYENIEAGLKEVQRDMSVLTEETEGKLQKEVRKCFYELEATVLSTLEVMRDELLPTGSRQDAGSSFPTDFHKKPPHSTDHEHAGNESKIISAGPLFSRGSSSRAVESDEKEAQSTDKSEPESPPE